MDTTMSAYDLLPKEDREAIAWVSKHGGLDALKHRCDVAIDREAVANTLLRELGVLNADDELAAALDVIGRRLIPEDMRWPRYGTGDQVRLGDAIEGVGRVTSVKFTADGVVIGCSETDIEVIDDAPVG